VAIATAHTADDQLETLLMRIARGAGLTGMTGMRARHGAWLKPLLHATRTDIERDLRRHALVWREDASNATLTFARNRVRHVVVPALLDALGAPGGSPVERRAPLARRAAVLAGELADAGRGWSRLVARGLDRALVSTSGDPALDTKVLAKLPPALLRLALARAWRLLGPAGAAAPGLTSRHLDALAHCLGGTRPRAQVALPEGWRALVERSRLRFEAPVAGALTPAATSRRGGRTDDRLAVRYGRARTGAVSGRSAPRRRRRTTPHDLTPA
jgi:tRNA(Ile)-lysidine synthase